FRSGRPLSLQLDAGNAAGKRLVLTPCSIEVRTYTSLLSPIAGGVNPTQVSGVVRVSHALRIYGKERWNISEGTSSRVPTGQTIRLTNAVVSAHHEVIIASNIGAGSLKKCTQGAGRIRFGWVREKVEHLFIGGNG